MGGEDPNRQPKLGSVKVTPDGWVWFAICNSRGHRGDLSAVAPFCPGRMMSRRFLRRLHDAERNLGGFGESGATGGGGNGLVMTAAATE
jgi:hypothetical protein